MIAVGDIVLCTITEIGPWGAYGVSESKLKVLVSFSELSWHRIEKTDDVISIGEKVEVVIIDERQNERPVFLGSIKRVNPENNPWHSPFMTVNQVVKAKVARIGEDVVFLELPNGIVVGVLAEATGDFVVGQVREIRLTKIVPESNKVEAMIVS